eukprot:scaffold77130_cov63-Phaeocystis_antarctica.AAC.5
MKHNPGNGVYSRSTRHRLHSDAVGIQAVRSSSRQRRRSADVVHGGAQAQHLVGRHGGDLEGEERRVPVVPEADERRLASSRLVVS